MMTSCHEQCGQAGDEPSILHVIVRTRSPQDQQCPHTTGDTDIFLISINLLILKTSHKPWVSRGCNHICYHLGGVQYQRGMRLATKRHPCMASCDSHLIGILHNTYNVRPPFDNVQLVNITPITMVYGCLWYL